MQDIRIKIKAINVLNFSTKDGSVELEILFNDYKTIKNIKIDNCNELAHDIIVEIRRKVKEHNQKDESDDILDGIVNVIIEDEEETIKKISMFLAKLSDKINLVKNTGIAENYLDMITSVKGMKLELK